jgi:uncharacterized membrane protein
MDMNAVAAAVFGGLIGAALVQIAHRPGRREVLWRLASITTALALLTELVTNWRHSRSGHRTVSEIVLVLTVVFVIFMIMSIRAGERRAPTGDTR